MRDAVLWQPYAESEGATSAENFSTFVIADFAPVQTAQGGSAQRHADTSGDCAGLHPEARDGGRRNRVSTGARLGARVQLPTGARFSCRRAYAGTCF